MVAVVGDFIQSIAARAGGEFAPDSANWTQAAEGTVEYQLSIPANWVGYLIQMSGYSSGAGVKVTFYDQDNLARWEWTDLLDTHKEYDVIPFTEKFYSGTIRFRFVNESTEDRNMGWSTIVVLIPEQNRIQFEQDVKNLSEIGLGVKGLPGLGASLGKMEFSVTKLMGFLEKRERLLKPLAGLECEE